MWVQSLGRKDPLEEGIATHSNVLTWRLPWTEEAGRLQSMGSQSQHDGAQHSTHSLSPCLTDEVSKTQLSEAPRPRYQGDQY